MPSDTVLNFVNKCLRSTGDYEPLATVVGSPAAIADRIVDTMNLVLADICRKIEFPELEVSFTLAADGINSQYLASGFVTRPRSGLKLTCGIYPVEEVSTSRLNELRDQNTYSGIPQVFARIAGSNGELGVDIYPTPAAGLVLTLYAAQEPTKFTVADAAVTEIIADDLIELGTIAHMDAYSGMERGYMQLYEAAKNRAWKDTFEHQAFRVECEDYH